MFAMTGAMTLTGVAAAAGTAKAKDPATDPNYLDTMYSFKNVSSVGYSECRVKNNTTKVYIHPTSGPMLYYRVQGATSYTGTGATDCSNAHGLAVGVKASFTNYVFEDGFSHARLKLRRSKNVQDYSVGYWSPDSSQNYTIYD